MKRSTPIRRNTPLRSTTGLKRTGRVNPISRKRRRLLDERRRVIEEQAAYRKTCEAGARINQADGRHRCYRVPQDVHEPLMRSRGGSIVDPSNMLFICRACHDWIHNNPALASDLDLLRSRYTKP